MKLCCMCGLKKPLSEFNKCKANKDGLQGHCAACGIEYKKKWYQNNKDWAKEYSTLKNYGVSATQFKDLLTKQNNKCAICKSELNISKKTHIDHCHTTGKIRGILCQECNHGLGLFKYSQDILDSAQKYLKKYS